MTETLRDLRDVQFAQVESAILRDPTITPQCKALYGLLITYGPSSIFPGQTLLGECLGVSRQTISRWMSQLRDKGLIDWKRRGSTSNEYVILGLHHTDTMSTVVDNRCKAGLTRSRSSQPDPDKKHKNVADATPTHMVPFNVIQQTIETSTNKQAVVRRICERLWPNKDPPSYAYIARIANRTGGYVMLAAQLVIANTQNVKGDPLAYVQAARKGDNGKNRGNHTGLGEGTGEKATTGQAAAIAAAFAAPVTDRPGRGGGDSG